MSKLVPGSLTASWAKKVEAATGRLERAPGDRKAVLLIDCSGSMAGEGKLEQARSGTVDFFKTSVGRGYKVGIVRFGSAVSVLAPLSVNVEDVRRRLTSLIAEGSTALHTAIAQGGEMLGKSGTRALCVVTDGMPDDANAAIEEARRAKATGVHISVVGTRDADWDFLSRIASSQADATVTTAASLNRAVASLSLRLPGPNAKQ